MENFFCRVLRTRCADAEAECQHHRVNKGTAGNTLRRVAHRPTLGQGRALVFNAAGTTESLLKVVRLTVDYPRFEANVINWVNLQNTRLAAVFLTLPSG